VVCSDRLEVVGEAARGYRADHPRPGWAEQDPALWERALAPAIGDALAAAGVEPDAVAALGVAGQLDGCVPTDAAGAPLGPCLIWMDRRARGAMPALPGDAGARTGVIPDPGHMAGKIRWLMQRGSAAARYHQPVSYLVARLTGVHVFDHGLASTTMLYELAGRDFAGDLLDAFEIDRDALPAIAGATDLAGPLTTAGAALAGLPAGTPVCVGTGDDFATPLGAGLLAPGPVACVLGTAEVVGALHPTAVVDPGALVETHAYPGSLYFVENPGWLAGGAIEWLCGLVGRDAAALDRAAAAVPPGADGLTFVPALSGAMAPRWIASARGAFHGLTPTHGVGHLGRAVMEGCAFAMRDVVDRLAELGVATDSILLAGGGARSAVWPQMRADLTRLPVDVADRADACPVGAAALAAVAAGIQPSLADCAALLAGGRQRVEPNEAAGAALDDAYAAYRSLFAALEPLWS
jgi:xylulokinase